MSAYELNPRNDGPPIEIRGLVNQFGDRVIHQDLDLTVERGKILGVVGGSGSGKTVLLKSILGLLRFKSGQINIFGQDIATASKKQKLDVQSRSGVLFQSGALFSSLTVLENIMVPMAEFTKLNRRKVQAHRPVENVAGGAAAQCG